MEAGRKVSGAKGRRNQPAVALWSIVSRGKELPSRQSPAGGSPRHAARTRTAHAVQPRQAARGGNSRKTRMHHEPIATPERSMALMEEALSPENWEAALRAVERNQGAPGPDGMRADELREHLGLHGEVIRKRLLEGRYRPGAAKRREIPKPGGGVRALSIPNVLDRFVQQLLLGVLLIRFEAVSAKAATGSGLGAVHTKPWKPPEATRGRATRGWSIWISLSSLTG